MYIVILIVLWQFVEVSLFRFDRSVVTLFRRASATLSSPPSIFYSVSVCRTENIISSVGLSCCSLKCLQTLIQRFLSEKRNIQGNQSKDMLSKIPSYFLTKKLKCIWRLVKRTCKSAQANASFQSTSKRSTAFRLTGHCVDFGRELKFVRKSTHVFQRLATNACRHKFSDRRVNFICAITVYATFYNLRA